MGDISGLSPRAQELIRAAQERTVNRQLNPLLDTLPDWVTGYRAHQIPAIERALELFETYDLVVVSAPTGSGKSLIGETVRRMMKRRGVYMCTTKSLQDQFARDYPYAKVLKGRSNYPTELYPDKYTDDEWERLSCEDCTLPGAPCGYCKNKRTCPYEVAKTEAALADVSVLNTSYFLTETNMLGDRSLFTDAEFVIADEADLLESALMNFVSVEVGPRRLEQLGIPAVEKVTVVDSWKEWIDVAVPAARKAASRIRATPGDHKAWKRVKSLRNLADSLSAVGADLDNGYWVYAGTGHDAPRQSVSFKPAWVNKLGKPYLWAHGQKWLLMSGTVISAQEMMDSLGWDEGYGVVTVPNTFPVGNRRVVYRPVLDMSKRASAARATHQEARPAGAGPTSGGSQTDHSRDPQIDHPDQALHLALASILAQYPDQRILVHSVSYDLTARICAALPKDRRVFTYQSGRGSAAALAEYLATPAAVLVAPSMDRGIDLPGDACRVQIVAKIPFPYLGDKQISTRLYAGGKAGRLWYQVQTVRTLVQMCGRAVRSETDWAVTFVLDRQFGDNLYPSGRSLFPTWFTEAIVWERP